MIPRPLIVAIQFLTWLPVPRLDDMQPDDMTRAAPLFPLVGLIIGVILVAAAWVASGLGSAIGALAVVVAWIAVTGALHLDGLGDVADALGAAHRDPGRFLAVLRDPHLGTFGVLALVVQVVAKLILVEDLMRHGGASAALLLIPAWARWGALVVARGVPPLAEGSGARLKLGVALPALAAALAGLVALSVVLAPALLVAPFIAVGLMFAWRALTGGITGDCLGAGIELTESVLLLAAVAGAALLR